MPSAENGDSAKLYLDDLQVGQRFASATHALDEIQVIEFASRFDPQPFHLDHEAARHSLFGGLAASGWHIASITMRLLVGGGLPIAEGIIGAGVEITWPKPTRPDDILRVESEIIEIKPMRSNPQRAVVTVRSETRNQDSDVVQTLMAKLIVPRRPQRETPAEDRLV